MIPEQKPLSQAMVSRPRHSRMSLLLDKTGLDLVVTSLVEDNSLLWRRLDFDPAAATTVRALENLVYDNPLLLSDFARVDVLIDTPRFAIVPHDKASVEESEQIFADLYPAERLSVEVSPVEKDGAMLATGVDADMAAFLRRTFNNPGITHRIAPLIRFFGAKNRLGNAGKMHIHLGAGTTDIIAFGASGLLMANTFATPTVTDALYFTLAAARELGFDRSYDRILISGDNSRRDELIPLLRRYVDFAMPFIFPSQLTRTGSDHADAPFELLILPLCE